jgi:nucleoside 2-deoxyribosyltransferase
LIDVRNYNAKIIYIAGPLFSEHERSYLMRIEEVLYQMMGMMDKYQTWKNQLNGLKNYSICFIPHRDAGDVGTMDLERNTMFNADINAIDNAKILIAVLDGADVDSGTSLELGYAHAKGDKKIFGLLTDKRYWKVTKTSNGRKVYGLNNMIWGVCMSNGKIFNSIESLIPAVIEYLNTL